MDSEIFKNNNRISTFTHTTRYSITASKRDDSPIRHGDRYTGPFFSKYQINRRTDSRRLRNPVIISITVCVYVAAYLDHDTPTLTSRLGGGTAATRRRRERRQRQRTRDAVGCTTTWPYPSSTGAGAVWATPPVTVMRPVAQVRPTSRPADDVPVAPTRPAEPMLYAPTMTLHLHPNEITEVETQTDRYLYLTRRFLNHFRRGSVPNPVPLSEVTITSNTDAFPAIPALVFGPMLGPGGTNVILYDQP
jgi:hypothetical protein